MNNQMYKHIQFGMVLQTKQTAIDMFVVQTFPSWIFYGYYPASNFGLLLAARAQLTKRFLDRNLHDLVFSQGKEKKNA